MLIFKNDLRRCDDSDELSPNKIRKYTSHKIFSYFYIHIVDNLGRSIVNFKEKDRDIAAGSSRMQESSTFSHAGNSIFRYF